MPVIVYLPVLDGVNLIRHEAVSTALVAASSQLSEPPNRPVSGDAVKWTRPVGLLAPLDALTVAAQVVTVDRGSELGEQLTVVDDAPSGNAVVRRPVHGGCCCDSPVHV